MNSLIVKQEGNVVRHATCKGSRIYCLVIKVIYEESTKEINLREANLFDDDALSHLLSQRQQGEIFEPQMNSDIRDLPPKHKLHEGSGQEASSDKNQSDVELHLRMPEQNNDIIHNDKSPSPTRTSQDDSFIEVSCAQVIMDIEASTNVETTECYDTFQHLEKRVDRWMSALDQTERKATVMAKESSDLRSKLESLLAEIMATQNQLTNSMPKLTLPSSVDNSTKASVFNLISGIQDNRCFNGATRDGQSYETEEKERFGLPENEQTQFLDFSRDLFPDDVDLVLQNLSEPFDVSISRVCQSRSDSAMGGGQSSYISDSEEFGFSCDHQDKECTSAVDAIRSARSIYDQRDKDFAEKGEVEGIALNADSFREIFQADSSVEDEVLLEECEKHFERQECQKPRFTFKSFWTSKKQEGCDHSNSELPIVPEDSTLEVAQFSRQCKKWARHAVRKKSVFRFIIPSFFWSN